MPASEMKTAPHKPPPQPSHIHGEVPKEPHKNVLAAHFDNAVDNAAPLNDNAVLSLGHAPHLDESKIDIHPCSEIDKQPVKKHEAAVGNPDLLDECSTPTALLLSTIVQHLRVTGWTELSTIAPHPYDPSLVEARQQTQQWLTSMPSTFPNTAPAKKPNEHTKGTSQSQSTSNRIVILLQVNLDTYEALISKTTAHCPLPDTLEVILDTSSLTGTLRELNQLLLWAQNVLPTPGPRLPLPSFPINPPPPSLPQQLLPLSLIEYLAPMDPPLPPEDLARTAIKLHVCRNTIGAFTQLRICQIRDALGPRWTRYLEIHPSISPMYNYRDFQTLTQGLRLGFEAWQEALSLHRAAQQQAIQQMGPHRPPTTPNNQRSLILHPRFSSEAENQRSQQAIHTLRNATILTQQLLRSTQLSSITTTPIRRSSNAIMPGTFPRSPRPSSELPECSFFSHSFHQRLLFTRPLNTELHRNWTDSDTDEEAPAEESEQPSNEALAAHDDTEQPEDGAVWNGPMNATLHSPPHQDASSSISEPAESFYLGSQELPSQIPSSNDSPPLSPFLTTSILFNHFPFIAASPPGSPTPLSPNPLSTSTPPPEASVHTTTHLDQPLPNPFTDPSIATVMAGLSQDQFAALMGAVTAALQRPQPTPTPPAVTTIPWKDAKPGLFYPDLPQDKGTGRVVTIDGQRVFRDVNAFVAEVKIAARKTSHAVTCQHIDRCLAGSAAVWFHDFLEDAERLNLINEPTPEDPLDVCHNWCTALVARFAPLTETPIGQMLADKFTIDRLRRGDSVEKWVMSQAALARQVGLPNEKDKIQLVHSCFDEKLKYVFQPTSDMTMSRYLTFVQEKAHSYRPVLLQEDKVHQAELQDLFTAFQGHQTQQPSAYRQANTPAAAATPAAIPPRPFIPTTATAPSMGMSRPCRFCQGAHRDHFCPQKPAGFGACRFCNGPHYASQCPNRPQDAPVSPGNHPRVLQPYQPPNFAMTVGPPSAATQVTVATSQTTQPATAVVQPRTQLFVDTADTSTSAWECQTCATSFGSRRLLFQHVMETGHALDQQTLATGAEQQQVPSTVNTYFANINPIAVSASPMTSLTDPSDSDDSIEPRLTADTSNLPLTSTELTLALYDRLSSDDDDTTNHDLGTLGEVEVIPTHATETPVSQLALVPAHANPPRTSLTTDFALSVNPTVTQHLAVTQMALPRPEASPPPMVIVSQAKPISGHGTEFKRFNYLEVEIQFHLNQPAFHVCLDTGCSLSLISRKFLLLHFPHIKSRLSPMPIPMRGINTAQSTNATEYVSLPFYFPGDLRVLHRSIIDHRPYTAAILRDFYIVPDLACNMLIGLDVQIPNGMTIDLHHMSLQIATCQIPPTLHAMTTFTTSIRSIPQRRDHLRWRVQTCEVALQIPPYHCALIPVTHKPLPKGVLLEFVPITRTQFEEQLDLDGGFHRVYIKHTDYALLFTNLTQHPLILPPNLHIGHIRISDDTPNQIYSIEDSPHRTHFIFAASLTTEPSHPTGKSKSAQAMPMDQAQIFIQMLDPSPGLQLPPQHLPTIPPLPEPTAPSVTDDEILSAITINPDLHEHERAALLFVLKRHVVRFRNTGSVADEPEDEWLPITLRPGADLSSRGPYHLNPKDRDALDSIFDRLQNEGKLAFANAATHVGWPAFVVWRNNKPRVVIDIRGLNAAVLKDSFPLARMEDILAKVAGHTYISVFDPTAAFLQRRIQVQDRWKATVVSHRGLEVFGVMLMGFKNGPQHMQRGMVKWLRFLEQWASVYIDDVSLLGKECYRLAEDEHSHTRFQSHLAAILQQDPPSWKAITDHAIQLELFLSRMNLGRLYFDPRKARVGFTSAKLLGKIVDAVGVISEPSKVAAIEAFSFPSSLKQLEQFIGLILYLGNTIPHAAQLLHPLQTLKTSLLKKAPYKGKARRQYSAHTQLPSPSEAEERSFRLCKAAVAESTKLHHMNSSHHTYIYVDGSKDFGFGAVALQRSQPLQHGEYPNPSNANILWYQSKRLTQAERNYWPTELEVAALVWIVRQARHILESVDHEVVIYTDHKSIEDLRAAISMKSTSTVRQNLRLVRAALFLNQYRFTLQYVPGHLNVLADALSRLDATDPTLDDYKRACGPLQVSKFVDINAEHAPGNVSPADSILDNFWVDLAVGEKLAASYQTYSKQINLYFQSTTIATFTRDVQEELVRGYYADRGFASRINELMSRLRTLRRTTNTTLEVTYNNFTLRFNAEEPIPTPIATLLEAQSPNAAQVSAALAAYGTDAITPLLSLFLIDNNGTTRLCIPPVLESRFLKLAHDDQNHGGLERTYQNIRGAYFFRKMTRKVAAYVSSCDYCLRNKNRQHKPYGQLQWISAPVRPWSLITLDFIVKLPPALFREVEMDSILTATDKTTRLTRLIMGKESWSAPEWAHEFYLATYPELGAPGAMISDRGSIFISAFWTTFFKAMGTSMAATTAHNPRANGQSEHANKEIEIAIRHLTNSRQDDWPQHIPHIQLAYNNQINSSTGFAPNQLLLGFIPNTALQLPTITQNEQSQHQYQMAIQASSRIELLDAYRAEAQDAITYSQFAIAKYFDKKHTKPPLYQVGDRVFLNIAKKGQTGYAIAGVSSRKLGPQRAGPYTITEVFNNGRAVRLGDLPPHSDIWPIISCIHLEPAPNEIRSATQPEPITIVDLGEEEGHQEFEVETILQSRKNNAEFRVKWKGYPIEQATWEPKANLQHCQQLLDDFLAKQTQRPNPRKQTRSHAP